MKITHLVLELTSGGDRFGVKLNFQEGLNIISAPNTSGKTTCLQAIIYVLGLERMLSPRRQIPLPYVMRTNFEDSHGNNRLVDRSSVSAEIWNEKTGSAITVTRDVVGGRDNRLISVTFGPALSSLPSEFRQQDFFVLDPGSASTGAGFHKFFAEFLEWSLPQVPTFEGKNAILYLETLFPLFYVEQKQGWSAIPALFPTFFGIRDVSRRAIEYILNLDAQTIRVKRQFISERIQYARGAWKELRRGIYTLCAQFNATCDDLPLEPNIDILLQKRLRVYIPTLDGPVLLEKRLDELKKHHSNLVAKEAPTVSVQAPALERELLGIDTELNDLEISRTDTIEKIWRSESDIEAVDSRIVALKEDMQKHKDARKLQRLGSIFSSSYEGATCPSCGQIISDQVLNPLSSGGVMNPDENIVYIESQLELLVRLRAEESSVLSASKSRLKSIDERVRALRGRIRIIKSSLVSPDHFISAAGIEERIRFEQEISQLILLSDQTNLIWSEVESLVKQYDSLNKDLFALRDSDFSDTDSQKLESLEQAIRRQLSLYGFSTFGTDEIEVARDNFKPIKAGYEIGFETSASDAIRLKWAYLLALFEVAQQPKGNHLGFLVFDEPKQQEASAISFEELLKNAADISSKGGQIIFGIMEEDLAIDKKLSGKAVNIIRFDGKMIKLMTA